MVKKDLHGEVKVPEGIQVLADGDLLTVKGPKGMITRKFDSPGVAVKVEDGTVRLHSSEGSKKDKAVINAYQAHLRNAFVGVKEPYTYRLKVCSGHFPMNVSVANGTLLIKNFLGEKVPRQVSLKEGATVKVEGSEIVVQATDKELAGQVAADIEQATRRPGFDRRIFQDGIYIIEKAGKKI